jgi:hypothetical protein
MADRTIVRIAYLVWRVREEWSNGCTLDGMLWEQCFEAAFGTIIAT